MSFPIAASSSVSAPFPTSPLGRGAGTNSGIGPAENGEIPFADLVKGLLQDTNQQQNAVQESVKSIISGETDSIHDVVLTASKADLAFRLVMEIRNRLISSYQEIMRMQV